MINSPLRAEKAAPLMVTATEFGSAGGVSLRGAATSVTGRHSRNASEGAPASERPATARAASGVAGERTAYCSVPCCHHRDRDPGGTRGDARREVFWEQRHGGVDGDVGRRADEADRGHLVGERDGGEAEPLARGVWH